MPNGKNGAGRAEGPAATLPEIEDAYDGIPTSDDEPMATPSAPDMTMTAFLARFEAMMQPIVAGQAQLVARQAAFEERIEQRLQAATEGQMTPHAPQHEYHQAGLIAPPVDETQVPAHVFTAADRHNSELVAFIPKDNQLNPRQGSYDTWCNGKMTRIKRGQIGMLPRGHAVEIAKAGHGYVVDITTMQALEVPTLPDYSRPDISGSHITADATSSVPREVYGQFFAAR